MSKIKICGLSSMEDIETVNRVLPDFIGFVFAPSRRRVSLKTAARLKENLDQRISTIGVFVNEDISTIAEIYQNGIIDMVQLHGGEDDRYIRQLKDYYGCRVIKSVGIGIGNGNGNGTSNETGNGTGNGISNRIGNGSGNGTGNGTGNGISNRIGNGSGNGTGNGTGNGVSNRIGNGNGTGNGISNRIGISSGNGINYGNDTGTDIGDALPSLPIEPDYLLFDTKSEQRGGMGIPFNWNVLKNYRGQPFFLSGGLSIENVSNAINLLLPYCVDISSGVETNGIKDADKIEKFVDTVRHIQPIFAAKRKSLSIV